MVNITSKQDFSVFSPLKQLSIKPPAQLAEALGIHHPGRWLGLYWEPELEQVCYTDGNTVNTGNAQSWQLFCNHSQVEPVLAPYRLGNNGNPAQHLLLLDRESRRLYIGESTLVEECLRHPESLSLLARLDASSTQPWPQPPKNLQSFKRYFFRTFKDKKLLFLLGVPIIVVAVYLLREAGDFVFDLLELWDD